MGSEMWYVFEFFLKIVVFVVQSGLKLYDPTVMAAGVQMNEFEIAPVRTTLTTEPSLVQQYGAQKDHYCAHLVKSIKLGILIV